MATLTKLGKTTTGLQQVSNKDRKYELPLTSSEATELVIIQFYELNNNAECCEIILQPQLGQNKVTLLINNTYRYCMLKSMGKLAEHLQQIVVLAKGLGAYKVTRPSEQYLVDELVDCICNNFVAIRPAL